MFFFVAVLTQTRKGVPMAHRISSIRNIKPSHKQLIIDDAARLLNGAMTLTRRILASLRRFAERRLRILIDNLALRRLLSGRRRREQSDRGGPPLVRRSHNFQLRVAHP
jgi:hypothetical protein